MKILVATDGSKPATHAVKFAVKLLRSLSSPSNSITLISVHDDVGLRHAKSFVGKGLWQGAGLLLLPLGVYASARAWLPSEGQRDDIARALTFVVLILSNLGLIHANRSWGRTALRGSAESNQQFIWIAAATVALLGVVLGIPSISRLFSFAAPPPIMLLAALGVAMLSMFWFEVVKRIQGRRLQGDLLGSQP